MLFFCLGEAYNNIHFACCQRNDIPNVAFPAVSLRFLTYRETFFSRNSCVPTEG